jgi:hypothetical protein
MTEHFSFSVWIEVEDDHLSLSYGCNDLNRALERLAPFVRVFPYVDYLDVEANRSLGIDAPRETLRVLIKRHGLRHYDRLVTSNWYDGRVYAHESFVDPDLAELFVDGVRKGAKHEVADRAR